MNITLKAKSSSGDSYDVDFVLSEGALYAYCSCKAGAMGSACKHRLALLRGEEEMLFDRSQAKELASVLDWVKQTDFPVLTRQLSDAEEKLGLAQRDLARLKKTVSSAMATGLRLTSTRGGNQ